MSVRTMARVWEHSKHKGTCLLMLLAIADFADDQGRAFPSVLRLALKCRTSTRNANMILAALRESRELTVDRGKGPSGTNRFRVALVVEADGQSPTPMKPGSPLKNSSPLQAPTNGGEVSFAAP